MALSEAQKQNLTTAWEVFAESEAGKKLIDTPSETPESIHGKFKAWLQIGSTITPGGGYDGAGGNSSLSNIMGSSLRDIVYSGNASPQRVAAVKAANELMQAAGDEEEKNALLKTLLEKEKRTLFTIPLIGTKMTTGKLIGLGAGGIGGFFLSRMLGPDISDGIIGYLIPVAGAVVGTMVGGMIEDGMNKPSTPPNTGAGNNTSTQRIETGPQEQLDLGTASIMPPLATPVVTGPQLNQPQIG